MADRNLILFYDADCGFCQLTINWLIKNVDYKITVVEYQNREKLNKFPDLDESLIDKEIQLIKEKSIHSGAKAIGFCLKNKNLNIYKIIGDIILCPFILPFAKICYKIISNNRTIISKLLKLNQCSIKY